MTEAEQQRERILWNKARHSKREIRLIQKAIGASQDGNWGRETQTMVEQWQHDHGLNVDGKVGSMTMAAMLADEATPVEVEWRDLTPTEVDRIISITVEIEAGSANPYDDMNRNAEYEGWFDKPKRDSNRRSMRPAERAKQPDHKPHRASKFGPTPSMIGLSWGIIQFSQDGGALGRVLERAYSEDPKVCSTIFGPDFPELLATVSARGKSGLSTRTLRGPRVRPVAGKDLWESPWTERFDRAADHEVFRRAQRAEARDSYFDPALEICKKYGLSGQGDLAVAFDMCVQYGGGGARKYFKKAHKKYGDVMSIHDVISVIGDKRGRERRHDVLAHCGDWVHYSDLA